ncbi:MAG: preprotein translocase subunit SecE [Anaerolineae bacterium]
MSIEMELKAKPIRSTPEVSRQRILGFIKELKEELKKVNWTTKAELQFCTKIVIAATFAFGLGIYVIDLLIKSCLDLVKVVVHLIFGL